MPRCAPTKNSLRRALEELPQRRRNATQSSAPAIVHIDHLALDRILDNLLTNAARYTERGSVSVELDGSPGFLVLQVADTGVGIPAEALEHVFHPGGSAPESRRGNSFGVGLSVVVELLDQIGGRLEVQSTPGAGTTFWVYLPITRGDRPSHPRIRLASGQNGQEKLAANGLPTRGVVTIRKGPE